MLVNEQKFQFLSLYAKFSSGTTFQIKKNSWGSRTSAYLLTVIEGVNQAKRSVCVSCMCFFASKIIFLVFFEFFSYNTIDENQTKFNLVRHQQKLTLHHFWWHWHIYSAQATGASQFTCLAIKFLAFPVHLRKKLGEKFRTLTFL